MSTLPPLLSGSSAGGVRKVVHLGVPAIVAGTIALSMAPTTAGSPSFRRAEPTAPNILIFLTDDQRATGTVTPDARTVTAGSLRDHPRRRARVAANASMWTIVLAPGAWTTFVPGTPPSPSPEVRMDLREPSTTGRAPNAT